MYTEEAFERNVQSSAKIIGDKFGKRCPDAVSLQSETGETATVRVQCMARIFAGVETMAYLCTRTTARGALPAGDACRNAMRRRARQSIGLLDKK
jgi:hypothetical protein